MCLPLEPGTFCHFFLTEGYLWDWLVAGAAILINLLVPANAVKPVTRYFNENDLTLSYPDHSSSVPSSALYVLVFVLPAVVFAVTAAIKRHCGLVDWHHAALSIAEGFALTTGFKRWLNLVGVYRPSWLTLRALGDASEMADARLSYPSGHSAYMFFSMTIVFLYLVGKLDLMHSPSQLLFLKAGLSVAPLALAAFVAVSRIADYKHSPADVNAGCFIGLMCGLFAYFLNYPSVFAYDSAYPKRRGQAAVRAAAKRRTGVAAAATRSSGGGADPEALAATTPGQKLYTEAEVAAMYGMPPPGTYSRRL